MAAFIDPSDELQGTTARKYYSAGSQRLAMRKDNTIFFLLTDHLGGTSITVEAQNGTQSYVRTGELRYSAWGETRYSFGVTPTNRRFTGQSAEPDLGIYFYGARWYDPYLNRMLSPDSIVPDPYNVLDWDRYAYARNNPVRYSDPSGHDAWDTIGQFATGFVFEFARANAWYSPQAQEALAVNKSESDAMLAGRVAADVTTVVVGVVEFAGGVTVATGGTIAGCAVTGCVASPAAIVVGAGEAAYGAATATAGAVGLGGNLAQIANNNQGGAGNQPQRKYVPSPKHNPQGGWGSPMDLGDKAAQQVLDQGIQFGNQIYGYEDGNVYIFQPDNAGGYHGYNVTGTDRIPVTVLRQWRADGVITNSEYSQMLKWGPKK